MTTDSIELPELPDAAPIGDSGYAFRYTADQMRSYALLAIQQEDRRLPVQWVGADGTQHEVSDDYAAQICKWVLDTFGDVPQVDAVIGSDPPVMLMAAIQQERERCAKIAESLKEPMTDVTINANLALQECADAIRRG